MATESDDSTDIIIFERSIIQKDKNDTITVRLTTNDKDGGLSSVSPQTLVVIEAFSFGSPIVTLTFIDGDGIYSNINKLSTSSEYKLTLTDGDIKTEPKILPLRISKVEGKNTVGGKSEQVLYKVTFVHTGWGEFLNKQYCRGWNDKTYSEIVEDVVKDVGYDEVDVKPSRGRPECVIQPHWPNHVFLKWIQNRSVSDKHGDHFEFGCTGDNKFFFKSISDIINENVDKADKGTLPILRLGGQDETSERPENKLENGSVPTYFTNFYATEHYMNSVINGAGGVNAMYYDFFTGNFYEDEVRYSEEYFLQMSDWGAIKEIDETTKYKIFGGRSDEAVDQGKVRVSSVSISTNQFTVSTENAVNIHVGDMVEVIVPSPIQMINPYSVIYSGFYLVAEVTHSVHMDEKTKLTTKLTLSRQGFDGTDVDGYIKSRVGKFIGDREVIDVKEAK